MRAPSGGVAVDGVVDDVDDVDDSSDEDLDVASGVWCEEGSARAAIAAAITSSVDQLTEELPRARAGVDPEGVHQARVATRRLRSDLRTFSPLVDADWCRRTRAELKWLADALGAVRDNDVMQMRLESVLDAAGVAAGDAEPLLQRLRREGGVARRKLIAVIDDERCRSLLRDLQRDAADPPTTPSALGRAERRLAPLVRRPWNKLARVVDALGKEPEVAALHRVRLLAKRTRYAAEAVRPVFGRDASRFASAVRSVQDELGELNDAEVAVAWLKRTAPDLEAADAFVAGWLAHHFREVADAHHHGWERSWKQARKRSAWLA